MQIYLKEKIGNPDLFTGRKQEITYFLDWIAKIKREISKSTALLSRRKTGKTAILQRLYNLTFEKNDGVIPFYYELQEGKKWALDFCQDFYLTYILQYVAFKTRNPALVELSRESQKSFAMAREAAWEVGTYLVDNITRTEQLVQEQRTGLLWPAVRDTPWTMAAQQNEFIVQFIDEFQFLNSEIYWDEAKTNHANDFAAGYMSTAEYRNAPLLVSGSWVGWLMHDLSTMLPGRFKRYFLEGMPAEEALEMVFRYALLEDIPVMEETAYLIAKVTEGNPFYLSGLMRSDFPRKDLTTEAGVLDTLEYETLSPQGEIRNTWLEYIHAALPRINQRYAKDIVLYLSKHRQRSMSQPRLKQELQLDLPDHELRKKLKALLYSDLIELDAYSRYQGVQDNIFDKIFRSEYGEDIETFLPQGVRDEYKALFEDLDKKYQSLSGKHNRYKGAFAEFMIMQKLKEAAQNQAHYQAMLHNLPDDFEFAAYTTLRSYRAPPLHPRDFQIDVWARAPQGHYSLIGEVKNREQTKFSLTEAEAFVKKAQALLQLEQVETYLLFVFSKAGWKPGVVEYLQAHHIAWSDDIRWVEKT